MNPYGVFDYQFECDEFYILNHRTQSTGRGMDANENCTKQRKGIVINTTFHSNNYEHQPKQRSVT
jgi:hypothetical protein